MTAESNQLHQTIVTPDETLRIFQSMKKWSYYLSVLT